jgi:hypothetical protein
MRFIQTVNSNPTNQPRFEFRIATKPPHQLTIKKQQSQIDKFYWYNYIQYETAAVLSPLRKIAPNLKAYIKRKSPQAPRRIEGLKQPKVPASECPATQTSRKRPHAVTFNEPMPT